MHLNACSVHIWELEVEIDYGMSIKGVPSCQDNWNLCSKFSFFRLSINIYKDKIDEIAVNWLFQTVS